MLTIWTNEDGRTREGLIAEKGNIIEGRPHKEDDESFSGGVIFGDLATPLVHSLKADRLFEVEPVGKRTKILLQTEPVEKKKVRILGIFKVEQVTKEKKIYGNLWKAPRVRIVRELDVAVFLRSLASNPDFWVRKAVAENPHTELEILQKLSSDKNGWVLIGVASNPNTDEQTLKKLCYCSDPLARAIAIRRSPLSLDALREIETQETEVMPKLVIKKKIKAHRDTPILSKIRLALSGY